MTAVMDLIRLAKENGLQLAAEHGRLKLKGSHQPPAELIDLLRQHKRGLLAYLTGNAISGSVTRSANDQDEPDGLMLLPVNHRRAYRALLMMRKRQQETLVSGGYAAGRPAILLKEWRRRVQTRLDLDTQQLARIEADLIQAGLIVVQHSLHIDTGDGQPLVMAEDHRHDAEGLAWPPDANGNYTGAAFVAWLEEGRH